MVLIGESSLTMYLVAKPLSPSRDSVATTLNFAPSAAAIITLWAEPVAMSSSPASKAWKRLSLPRNSVKSSL